jgi:hypothetical protein
MSANVACRTFADGSGVLDAGNKELSQIDLSVRIGIAGNNCHLIVLEKVEKFELKELLFVDLGFRAFTLRGPRS